jgi:hypothetical protein
MNETGLVTATMRHGGRIAISDKRSKRLGAFHKVDHDVARLVIERLEERSKETTGIIVIIHGKGKFLGVGNVSNSHIDTSLDASLGKDANLAQFNLKVIDGLAILEDEFSLVEFTTERSEFSFARSGIFKKNSSRFLESGSTASGITAGASKSKYN